MIAPNPNLLCEQAKLYYYDFLHIENRRLVPKSMISHIEQCQQCQEQVNQLEGVLSQTEDHAELRPKQVSSAIITMLKLHFSYISKGVTCETVKPFLPSLLDPALEIRIPTPITAHLDNCRQCTEDLETIGRLNLSRRQLYRLSQLFAEELPRHSEKCSKIGEIAKSVAAMDFGGITAEALKHLCTCPVCRDSLYQERQKMRNSLPEHASTLEIEYESISATDIFDYVLPYGLEPTKNQYAQFRGSLMSHMRSCRKCLAKMQQLHNTVYSVAERAASKVVTIYHIDESAKDQLHKESGGLYAGFPIKVEIACREDRVDVEQPAATSDFVVDLKQKASALSVKPLLKTGLAAAAVILIGLALLLTTQTAKAVTIEQIYKAIENVKNVYIASFAPDEKEPIQEFWVSKTLRIQQIKTKKASVLLDISNKVRKVRHSDTGLVETVPLPAEMITETEKVMAGFLGLVPFSDLSLVPKDAEWEIVANNGLEAAGDIETYDLTWTDKAYDGSLVFKKWRVFVDLKTNLPQKTKFYDKLSADGEYALKSVMVVEYPSDSEMQEVIKESFF